MLEWTVYTGMPQYFDLLIEDLLKEVLTENNQMNSSGRICNVDVIGDHSSIDQMSVMESYIIDGQQ